jgi:hypothetical protein
MAGSTLFFSTNTHLSANSCTRKYLEHPDIQDSLDLCRRLKDEVLSYTDLSPQLSSHHSSAHVSLTLDDALSTYLK